MIKQELPTLYQKKATGKIKKWTIKVIENSTGNIILRTVYGEVDGKMVTADKQINITRANRDRLAQGKFEAKQKWDKKTNKEGYIENKDAALTTITIRPMLAPGKIYVISDNPDKESIKFPCYADAKADGNRALMHCVDEEIMIQSRSGTNINNFDHIRGEMENFLAGTPESLYIDGELYTHDLPFNVINGLANKKSGISGDDLKQMEKIKYYIFDCFDIKNLDVPFKDRRLLIEKLFKGKKFKHLLMIPSKLIYHPNEIKPLHDKFVKEGFEGLMLKNLDAPYELNKRSRHMRKYKEFLDEEFKIIGFHEGEGSDAGTVIWECQTNKKPYSTFAVRPKGDVAYRKQLFQDAEKHVGKWLTVKFQEYTDDKHGIPRFPVGKDFRSKTDLS